MADELSRVSALASRHTALGSGLEDWNGMGTAWTYDSDPNDEHAAVEIWDQLAGNGVLPCSFTSLDKVRIEAGLLFFGYDMTAEHTPWEVGLGFTINLGKADYRGRNAAAASRSKPRFVAAGIVADLDDMLAGGEALKLDGEAVGTVNSPCWSHRSGKSLALVHLRPDAAAVGTVLDVVGDDISCRATVTPTPFHDPTKSRTHA